MKKNINVLSINEVTTTYIRARTWIWGKSYLLNSDYAYFTRHNKHTWRFGTFSDNYHVPLHVFEQYPHCPVMYFPELSTVVEHQAPPALLLGLQHVGPGHVFPLYVNGNLHFFPTWALTFEDLLGLFAAVMQSVAKV